MTPKQMGTGQKCSMADRICPPLNICAPKPHQRWVPRFAPSPLVSMRSRFGCINAHFERARPRTTHTPGERPRARRTARSNALSVFDRGVYLLKQRDKVLFPQLCQQAFRGGTVDGVKGGEVGLGGRTVGEAEPEEQGGGGACDVVFYLEREGEVHRHAVLGG